LYGVQNIEERLVELINKKVVELGCKVIALGTMPDHVHLFVQANPQLPPNKIIGQIR